MGNYYKEQLAKIEPKALGSAANIQITKNGVKTNWLSLNDESAKVLTEWLKENFKVDTDK